METQGRSKRGAKTKPSRTPSEELRRKGKMARKVKRRNKDIGRRDWKGNSIVKLTLRVKIEKKSRALNCEREVRILEICLKGERKRNDIR
jgi:hypothetical protein